jgi:hypothetical protein
VPLADIAPICFIRLIKDRQTVAEEVKGKEGTVAGANTSEIVFMI